MTAFIFSTNCIHKYNDVFRYNQNTNLVDIEYMSQKVWRVNDKVLMNIPNIHVFYRDNKQKPFKYIGKVVERSVLNKRTNYKPLIMKFIIDSTNTTLCQPGKVFSPLPFKGRGRYKLGVFDALQAIPKTNGVNTGIVVVDL